MKCSVCWAWSPKQWDGSKGGWADTVAQCRLKDKFTTAGECCEDGALIKPKDQQKREQFVPRRVKERIPDTKFEVCPPPVKELYAHQIEAFEQFKDESVIGLFMECGVGKSATVLRIASYKFKQGMIDALLIVAPNDVHFQWASQQIPEWLDCAYDIQCLFGRGGNKTAYAFEEDPDLLQVVVVNIDTFSTPMKWKDIAAWSNSKKTMIVLDEATVIKNVQSKRTERLLYEFNDVIRRKKTVLASVPKTVARAVLTGTPVTNGPSDLWPMFEFLQPNYFGRNWYSFQAHFGMFTTIAVNDRVIKVPLNEQMWHAIKGINIFGEANALFGCSEDTFNTIHSQEKYEGPYKHADELRDLIKPVSYFKLLRDCVDMPAENRVTRLLQMTPEIAQCYEDMVNDLLAQYEDHVTTAQSKLTVLIRLQQICSGFICDKTIAEQKEDEERDVIGSLFGLSDEYDIMPDEIKWIGSSNPKLEALYRDIAELAHPLIIITRFTAEAARIFDDLSKNYSCCLMTGWKRVGTIEEFQQGKYDIMIANSAVIARGFNLQNSHVILFYSNTFSLEIRLQAEGRIFRIGQEHPCEYLDYAYENTVDEKIVGALSMKRSLLDYVRGVETIKELV